MKKSPCIGSGTYLVNNGFVSSKEDPIIDYVELIN
jgi:hypothetical protein